VSERKQIRVQLDYPLEHVRDPIIYHLVTDYRLVPNIRRANIDVHTGGMLVLEIVGEEEDLEGGIEYLRSLDITVTEIGTEQPWTV
jgi:hypothetical protein